jgi:hypothetical protein
MPKAMGRIDVWRQNGDQAVKQEVGGQPVRRGSPSWRAIPSKSVDAAPEGDPDALL